MVLDGEPLTVSFSDEQGLQSKDMGTARISLNRARPFDRLCAAALARLGP